MPGALVYNFGDGFSNWKEQEPQRREGREGIIFLLNLRGIIQQKPIRRSGIVYM
jgi:hypothetical protein